MSDDGISATVRFWFNLPARFEAVIKIPKSRSSIRRANRARKKRRGWR